MDYISITNAKEILNILSNHFGINPITVKSHRSIANRAYAVYNRNKIVISLWSTMKQENVLIHEFAHLLSFNRYGDKGIGHNEYFRICLVAVIKAWYNDIDQYQWNCEYKSIKKWYNKRYNRNV